MTLNGPSGVCRRADVSQCSGKDAIGGSVQEQTLPTTGTKEPPCSPAVQMLAAEAILSLVEVDPSWVFQALQAQAFSPPPCILCSPCRVISCSSALLGLLVGTCTLLRLSHTCRRMGLTTRLVYLILAAFLRQPLGKHCLWMAA